MPGALRESDTEEGRWAERVRAGGPGRENADRGGRGGGGRYEPAAPAAATRVPGVATGDAERATIERALQDADSLLRRDWRAELRPVLDKLPEARETRTVTGPLSGQIMADTVHLPAKVEVTGD